MKLINTSFALLALAFLAGPAPSLAASDADDGARAEVRQTAEAVLQKFYDARPRLRPETRGAAGYAVFTTAWGNFFGDAGRGERGIGLALDGGKSRETFMEMAQAPAVAQAVPEREILIVFGSAQAYEAFVARGWKAEAGAELPADAKVYTFTRTGVEVGTPLAGMRFWNDRKLN